MYCICTTTRNCRRVGAERFEEARTRTSGVPVRISRPMAPLGRATDVLPHFALQYSSKEAQSRAESAELAAY